MVKTMGAGLACLFLLLNVEKVSALCLKININSDYYKEQPVKNKNNLTYEGSRLQRREVRKLFLYEEKVIEVPLSTLSEKILLDSRFWDMPDEVLIKNHLNYIGKNPVFKDISMDFLEPYSDELIIEYDSSKSKSNNGGIFVTYPLNATGITEICQMVSHDIRPENTTKEKIRQALKGDREFKNMKISIRASKNNKNRVWSDWRHSKNIVDERISCGEFDSIKAKEIQITIKKEFPIISCADHTCTFGTKYSCEAIPVISKK